jgi:mono/diheme cytochrome c family protein
MTFTRRHRRSHLPIGVITVCTVSLLAVVAVEATMAQQSPQKQAAAAIVSSNPDSGKPEAIDAGRALYGTWCVQCHGPKADGVSRFGKYAGDLRVFWRGYSEFVTIVKNGRTQKQMPPWKEVLDDAKIAQIGAYLETLALEGANWK